MLLVCSWTRDRVHSQMLTPKARLSSCLFLDHNLWVQPFSSVVNVQVIVVGSVGTGSAGSQRSMFLYHVDETSRLQAKTKRCVFRKCISLVVT